MAGSVGSKMTEQWLRSGSMDGERHWGSGNN